MEILEIHLVWLIFRVFFAVYIILSWVLLKLKVRYDIGLLLNKSRLIDIVIVTFRTLELLLGCITSAKFNLYCVEIE
jgi:hypothetical protein